MKETYKRVIIGIFTIFLIIIMFLFVDIDNIIENLYKISLLGIFLFILTYSGVFILRTIRLQLIFHALNLKTSFLPLLGSYGIGWGINELTPGKIGDLARIEVIHKKSNSISLSQSVCGVAIERFIDLIILFFLTILALIYIYIFNIEGNTELNLHFYIGIGALILTGGFIMLILLFFRADWILNVLGKISLRLQKIFENFIKNFLQGVNDFRKNKKTVVNVILISIPIWSCEALTLVFLFYLTGFEINVFIILIAQIILFFSKTFPLTPGGWIVSENIGALLIFIFFPLTPYNIILSIFILDHILRTAYVLIYGVSSTLFLNIKLKKLELKPISNEVYQSE